MIIYKTIKKIAIALALCLLFIPFSRYISPTTLVDGHKTYLAYLPLSFIMAMIIIYGRSVIIPLTIGSLIIYSWLLDLAAVPLVAFIFCLLFPLLIASFITRSYVGRRWRFGLPNKGMGQRIFWLGFAAPLTIKLLMYLTGNAIAYPPELAPFFGGGSVIYMIVDVLNLVVASLIFTPLFYYPLRMALNPHFAVGFWRRCMRHYRQDKHRLYTPCWLVAWVLYLVLMCSPWHSELISGYLVPLVFVLFTLGIRRLDARLVSLLWGISAWVLLTYNTGFLQGVNTQYALSFILSVFISFTVCLLYMAISYHKNEWMKRVYHLQAQTDPLTKLPNLRALEEHILTYPTGALCCLRMANFEFLSRHYGMMMRIYCKKTIARELQPWLLEGEKIFQLPGSELLLFLREGETEARLTYFVEHLNNKKIPWHNAVLEIEYGASWGIVDSPKELQRMLGQLSYLAEKASDTQRVLGLDSRLQAVSGQTTERVLLLQKIKRAIDEEAFQLYAQPIVDGEGKGYHEILSRLVIGGQSITPDKFIPIVAEFNLSTRFDMMVMKMLLAWLAKHPGDEQQARFSVNLMPLTLMQKEIAQQIVDLFEVYKVPTRAVVIEVTEEQAFSNSETSNQNIALLREKGFKIAIDDFGTGYANYERLKKLQADIIKIDGCFVRDITSDVMDKLIVKSICKLAAARSLSVVAEYVETQEQRDILLQLGVQYLQGYLVGKPEPLQKLKH
ncbi:sensor domain-containing phosphodiesterase [Cedecea sp. NFIX57]|uniref:sensor domain-containing phosphodiesterase n=1 Tax=Cedecea sp. NFIX57 TaxID=1566286 RepID=UPI000A0A6FC6|nr:EAL domain-containing protein [Cedecea sp. NFIX57]SMG06207.1 EAL domain, c-di-GMP-specific phosphodiesterase class I (or its enzymatically inactive variant) [Cedecea sp. NFIX57]